jgi:hypothetical protein
MSILVIMALSLHALAAVFWAGATFVLARNPDFGAEKWLRPQMIAALIAVLTGAYLWHLLHEGGFGPMEGVLAFGALSAIAAAGVQGALVGGSIRRLRNGVLSKSEALGRIALAERIAAGLIAMTIVCMVSSRYV